MDHRLFCKPDNQIPACWILYSKEITEPSAKIDFRSMDLSTDLDTIYGWVNLAYSKRFWQLNGTKSLVETTYRLIIQNPGTHSFLGLLHGRPVCQIDVYLLSVDELGKEVLDCGPNDCGFHLLMIPPQQSLKGLSKTMLRAFFEFYFSFDESERLFGEPDRENTLANRLAVSAGMEFLYKIQLSYKEANLYSITKLQFHETQPHH
jgi:acetyl CoA:N6-hydroxylysine acetyl transferase